MEAGLLHEFLGIFPRKVKDIIFAWRGARECEIEPTKGEIETKIGKLWNSETQTTQISFLGGGGVLDWQKTGNKLSLDLHKSGNELSLDLHKSSNQLSLELHKSGNELSLDSYKSGNELSLDLHRSCSLVVN